MHLRDAYNFNQSENLFTVISSNHDDEVDYGVARRDRAVDMCCDRFSLQIGYLLQLNTSDCH